MQNIETKRLYASAKEIYTTPNIDLYERAIQECIDTNDEETARAVIRKRRNELLEKTDARMSLDRIGLTAPSYTLTGLIEFVRTLVNALSGDWAKYRQALRDIPNQPGFPFAVEWPQEPKEE